MTEPLVLHKAKYHVQFMFYACLRLVAISPFLPFPPVLPGEKFGVAAGALEERCKLKNGSIHVLLLIKSSLVRATTCTYSYTESARIS